MTKRETVALFGLIAALFPRDDNFRKPDAVMRDAWAEMLEDIPFDNAKAAIKASVSTSPFPPSIAEIRDYATRANGPRRLTAEEAWGHALDVMRRYGMNLVPIEGFKRDEAPARFGEPVKIRPSGVEWEAMRHCRPDVWAILEHMGYQDMCCTDDLSVVRGQFMRAWTSHDQEAKEYRVMGSLVPELFSFDALTPTGIAERSRDNE